MTNIVTLEPPSSQPCHSSPVKIKSAGGFDSGEVAMYCGKPALIVDFIPATDRWGQRIDGHEALLYTGTVFLSQINTSRLIKLVSE